MNVDLTWVLQSLIRLLGVQLCCILALRGCSDLRKHFDMLRWDRWLELLVRWAPWLLDVGSYIVSLDILLHVFINAKGSIAQLAIVSVVACIQSSAFCESVRAACCLLTIFALQKELEFLMNTLALYSTGYLGMFTTLNLLRIFLLILRCFYVYWRGPTAFWFDYDLLRRGRLIEVWMWSVLRGPT